MSPRQGLTAQRAGPFCPLDQPSGALSTGLGFRTQDATLRLPAFAATAVGQDLPRGLLELLLG
eukprot:2322117-Alexandrium_andersonii.AAC.1